MTSVAEATGLTIRYTPESGDSVLAVSEVDLRLEEGEFVTLIGPSGCGKSTLLHTVGGLLRPTAGEVKVRGEVLSRPDPKRAAFVFQEYTLLPWKTIVENVALGLRFSYVSKRERRAVGLRFLEDMGLAKFAESKPRELSGGMQQRVAVARALAMEPDLLLMDEPFGALDEQTRLRVGEEVSRVLSMAGRSALFVTHSLDEAVLLADRIVLLSSSPGRVKEVIDVGEPKPRKRAFMSTARFGELRSRIFAGLEEPDLGDKASI